MMTLPPYRAAILPGWIDYNGHLRDAYYGLILSLAIDEVMDHLGLDAPYRERTRCTLYTLETHIHYLAEVKAADALDVVTSILDADAKRLHLGCRFTRGRRDGAAAAGEAMLLHVHQGETVRSAPFPVVVERRLADLKLSAADSAAWGPRSRVIEMRRRPA